jgi:hypothetical protein
MSALLDTVGGFVAQIADPAPGAMSAWSDGDSGPWVGFLTDRIGRSGVGVKRFAIAHQLGHVVAGDEPATCAAVLNDETVESTAGPGESFANAFACYLLAPAAAVHALVGESAGGSSASLRDSARAVAVEFGLSPGAAIHHVLNCIRATEVERRVAELRDAEGGHPAWIRAVGEAVDDVWDEDRARFEDEVGSDAAGLEFQPRSARRDRWLAEAIRDRKFSDAEQRALA